MQYGGAIHAYGSSTALTVTGSTFDANTAGMVRAPPACLHPLACPPPLPPPPLQRARLCAAWRAELGLAVAICPLL